jgi:hypothetical protein
MFQRLFLSPLSFLSMYACECVLARTAVIMRMRARTYPCTCCDGDGVLKENLISTLLLVRMCVIPIHIYTGEEEEEEES